MMGKFIDLTGQRFGRLTVIERVENDKRGKPQWLCRCDCGNLKAVHGSHLRRGAIQSCGCLHNEMLKNIRRTHGGCGSRLYRIWKNIHSRCYNANVPTFPRYGGRGITVCKEWKDSFEAFRDWALTHGYQDGLTIDRIDVDGPYAPENCRSATIIEQANNKRNNRFLSFDGETRTLAEWLKITNISRTTLQSRLKSGWSVERALTEPIHKKYRKKK